MKRLSLFVVVFALVAAGCGGGGGGSSSPALAPALTMGSATILIPNRAPNSVARGARFVSAAVISAKMSIASLADQIFDLSSASNRCTSASGGRTCTIGFNAPLGSQTITLTLYDAANATGNALGVSQLGFTFSATGGNNLGFTINANVASMSVAIVFAPGNPTGAFIVGQTNSASVFVTAKDADGNVIVSPGNYNQPATITNSDTSGAFTLSGSTTVNGPNTGPVLNYNGKQVGAVTIGATATGVSSASITPAVIFGGTTPPPSATATATPSAAVTPTPAPTLTSFPAPGQNCTAPALGPGAWTTFFSLGTVSGNVYTGNSAASASSWVKFNYAGAATPVPSATNSTPSPGAGSQAVNVYFGTYTLPQGTTGCAIFVASTDGSPIALFSSSGSFNSLAIGAPNVNAAATTLAGSGTITALTVTLTGSSGTGTVTLSNGDTGTISVSGMVTINIPTSSSTGGPTPTPTLGPVVLVPSSLTFNFPGDTRTVAASQSGNSANSFTNTGITCPGSGSGTISQTSPGNYLVTASTTSNGQTCTATISGLGGRSATLSMTF